METMLDNAFQGSPARERTDRCRQRWQLARASTTEGSLAPRCGYCAAHHSAAPGWVAKVIPPAAMIATGR